MLNRLKQLFGGKDAATDVSEDDSSVDQSTLSQQRAASMDLAERERRIKILETEVQRLNASQQNVVYESVNAKLASFFSDVSGPVSHLLTQIHLVDEKKREVNANDTFRLVKQLMRRMEEAGLQIDSPTGEKVKFDPNHHEPLSSDTPPKTGDVVHVRVPGLAYNGRVLRKAGVSASES